MRASGFARKCGSRGGIGNERERVRESRIGAMSSRAGRRPSRKSGAVGAKTLHRAPRHRPEPGPDEAFELVERLAAENRELHQVRGIGALPEVDHLLPEFAPGPVRERLLGPDMEPREGMPRVEGLLPRREASQVVATAPRHVLRVDDPALAREVLAVEPGGNEELGEPVERAVEVRGVDLEEVRGVRERGARVAEAPVSGDEPVVLARVRVLSGAEEEQVLEEVRHSRAPLGVVGAPHVDVERGRRLVGARIGDDQGLESVLEGEYAVAPGVGGAALDLDSAAERGRGAGEQQQRERRASEKTERDRGSVSGQ